MQRCYDTPYGIFTLTVDIFSLSFGQELFVVVKLLEPDIIS